MYNMGISGIGWNPLGNVGLGMSGAYGSYDAYMPSMMGMNYGMGMMNPMSSMGGMMGGMMGAYPTFMAQMQNVQNMLEKNQAQHSSAMHHILHQNEVNALRTTDSSLILKKLTNGGSHEGIAKLYAKVREGDQDGIRTEFTNLKNEILHRYSKEFAAYGDKINPSQEANKIIKDLYSRIIHAQTGQIADLEADIKRYGDSSLVNGIMQGLRTDHHGSYVDETLNYCFGYDIDQKGSKDMKQTIGKGLGSVASALEKGVYGLGIGAGLTGIGIGLLKGLNTALPGKGIKSIRSMGYWKPMRIMAIVAGLAGMAADIWWKHSKS